MVNSVLVNGFLYIWIFLRSIEKKTHDLNFKTYICKNLTSEYLKITCYILLTPKSKKNEKKLSLIFICLTTKH